ncbi:GrpB family protein [Tessaracoccus sp. HDW20]|nr:GrpB family protein [Tessaracoccus coleopterorum]
MTIVPSRHLEWVGLFEEMAGRLGPLLPGAKIEHIGSTSVPDLPAKDVVDLLIGVDLPRCRRWPTSYATRGSTSRAPSRTTPGSDSRAATTAAT